MVGYKIVYDQALIHFAIICDLLSKGANDIITHSVKIGFWFYAHFSRTHPNCDRIFRYCWPKCVGKCVFCLCIRRYAQTDVFSGARRQVFILSLHLHPYTHTLCMRAATALGSLRICQSLCCSLMRLCIHLRTIYHCFCLKTDVHKYRPILTSDGSKVRRVYLGARER